MSDPTDSFPPDVEPIPDDHDFYDDLASLVEEYEDEEGMDRERLLYGASSFGDYWLEQLFTTGSTW